MQGRRQDTREKVWFRLNIGRERNADPKWILPLICKAGGISKSEIGAIKIFDRETRFEITAEHAEQFVEAVRTNKNKEGHISRMDAQAPRDDATVATPAAQAATPPGSHSARNDRHEHRPKRPWQDRDRRPASGPRAPHPASDKSAKKDHRGTERPHGDARPDSKYKRKRKNRVA